MVVLVIIGWEKLVAFCFLPIYFRSCVLLNYFIIRWAGKAKSEAKNSRDSRVEFISKDLVTRPTYIRSTYRYLRIIFFRNNIFILSEHGLNLKGQSISCLRFSWYLFWQENVCIRSSPFIVFLWGNKQYFPMHYWHGNLDLA